MHQRHRPCTWDELPAGYFLITSEDPNGAFECGGSAVEILLVVSCMRDLQSNTNGACDVMYISACPCNGERHSDH